MEEKAKAIVILGIEGYKKTKYDARKSEADI